MVDDVDKSPEEAAYNEVRRVQLHTDKCQPDADEYDADIFDAAAGQQAFQVALPGCQGNAVYRRPDAKQEKKPADPGRQPVKKRQRPQNAVDTHLQHHAGHHG